MSVGRLVGWSVENFLHLEKSKFFEGASRQEEKDEEMASFASHAL